MQSFIYSCRGRTVPFNGAQITLYANGVTLNVSAHLARLNVIATNPVNNDEYTAQRARGAYIASIC